MPKVIKLKPRDSSAARTRYTNAIQGTTLEAALEEQRSAAWEIESVLLIAADSLERIDADFGTADYSLVLRAAAKRAAAIANALEGGPLEDRATAIAKREAETAEGAA